MKETPIEEESSGSSSEDNSDEPTSDEETDDDEGETKLVCFEENSKLNHILCHNASIVNLDSFIAMTFLEDVCGFICLVKNL